jgi:hypothetical protein
VGITLKPRTHHKLKPSKPLKGEITELSINFPSPDIAFVVDLHGGGDPQPWDPATVMDEIRKVVEQNYTAHFGVPFPKP